MEQEGWAEGRAAGTHRRRIQSAEAGAALEIRSAGAGAGQKSSVAAAGSLAEGSQSVGAAGQGIRLAGAAGIPDADRESQWAAERAAGDYTQSALDIGSLVPIAPSRRVVVAVGVVVVVGQGCRSHLAPALRSLTSTRTL